LLLVADQRFPDGRHRQIKQRLLDHPPLLDQFSSCKAENSLTRP
jgi:hypothetical protein